MPVITNAGGGGGAGSDDCTLLRANVPKGLKAVTADSEDEALEGILDTEASAADSHVLDKMSYLKYNPTTKLFEKRIGNRKNNGALNAKLKCGQSYEIPAGDTTGGVIEAESLASQTPGNLAANKMLAGTHGVSNGARVDGNIGSVGGPSITPQTYAQAISVGGKYVTGNGNVAGVALPPAAALKKGYRYWIGNNYVDGNFEGYVSSPLYLYNNGAWGGGQSGGTFLGTDVRAENAIMSNYIQYYGLAAQALFRLNNSFDLSPYKYLKLVVEHIGQYKNITYNNAAIKVKSGNTFASADVASVGSGNMGLYGNNTIVLDISSLNGFYWLFFSGGNMRSNGQNLFDKTAIRQIYLTNN